MQALKKLFISMVTSTALWLLFIPEKSEPPDIEYPLAECSLYREPLKMSIPPVPTSEKIQFHCPRIGPKFIASSKNVLALSNDPHLSLHQINCYYYNHTRWLPLKEPTYFEGIQAHVQCRNAQKLIYEDYLPMVPLHRNNSANEAGPALKIIVIVLGSASKRAFYMWMNETGSALRKLHALEFKNFTSVGIYDRDNIHPLLRGPENEANAYLWKHLKELGYYTAYLEDGISENLFRDDQDFDFHWAKGNRIEILGSNWFQEYPYCIRDREYHDVLLNQASDILDSQSSPTFLLMVLNGARDRDAKLGSMDSHLSAFFQKLRQNGHHENSVIFFVSDHGRTYGYSEEIEAHYWDRFDPFAYVALPKWFRKAYHEQFFNFYRNKNALVTSYDLHETLLALVTASKRGGLFNVLKRDSCKDANIPEIFCPCLRSKLSKGGKSVRGAMKYILYRINRALVGTACAKVEQESILDARLVHSVQVYRIRFTLKPLSDEAIFEAYLKELDGRFVGWKIYRLTFMVPRKCFDKIDDDLRPFCYC